MAGRRHQPPPPSSRQREPPSNREPLQRSVGTSARSTLLEDRIAVQQRELQTLLLDNQRLAAAHVALKQELALSDQDIRHLLAAASEVKADRDREARELYDRSLKMEADVRGIEEVSREIVQVRGDLEKLREDRRELCEELDKINDEIAAAKKEVEVVGLVKGEIETLKREIQRGRLLELLKRCKGEIETLSVAQVEKLVLGSDCAFVHAMAEGGGGEWGWSPPPPAYNAAVNTQIRPHQSVSCPSQLLRAALECEKKTTVSNNEHEQTMEKNMIALAREIERLRAEWSNAEKRALEAAAAAAAVPNPNAGYAGNNDNPEVSFGGNPYPDPYPMHQGGIVAAPPFASAGMPSGPYDLQQLQTQMSMQAP